MTRFLWITMMASSKKVDGILDQWLKDNIPWMRARHGLKGFKFQMDNGELNSIFETRKQLIYLSCGYMLISITRLQEKVEKIH